MKAEDICTCATHPQPLPAVAAKRKTSTAGKDYVPHIKRGERTLCGRLTSSVNCAGEGGELDLTEESGCRVCVRRRWDKVKIRHNLSSK
jgi:hypothetical protein